MRRPFLLLFTLPRGTHFAILWSLLVQGDPPRVNIVYAVHANMLQVLNLEIQGFDHPSVRGADNASLLVSQKFHNMIDAETPLTNTTLNVVTSLQSQNPDPTLVTCTSRVINEDVYPRLVLPPTTGNPDSIECTFQYQGFDFLRSHRKHSETLLNLFSFNLWNTFVCKPWQPNKVHLSSLK